MDTTAEPDGTAPLIEPLLDSTGLLGDRAALDERYRRDGYLYLRQVLPTQEVERVRAELFAALAGQGVVRIGAEEAQLRLDRADDVDMAELHEAVDYRSLWDHPASIALFEELVGEPVWMFRSCQIRCTPVAEDWSLAPSHQDANYIGPNDDFRTAWTPLTRVDRSMGGVALAAGSHRAGLLQAVERERFRSDGTKGPSHLTIPDEAIDGRWVAATVIEPGDVLVFNCYLVHRSLPNRSPEGRVRLSMDTRTQPARSPRGPSAMFRAPELEVLVAERGLAAMKERVAEGEAR